MAEKKGVAMGQAGYGFDGDILCAYGIGSCVVVVLYDSDSPRAAMLHAILPERPDKKPKSARYVDSGIEEIFMKLVESGANTRDIEAKIYGGATMFETQQAEEAAIGPRNIKKAKETLERKGIPLTGEDTGGNYGRTIEFFVSEKKANVKSFKHGTKIV
ncbi:MAG TPA: chemotaxis protein CheD [bacterium]|nr:chemotaxis protein CheD [bacterium]